MKPSTINVLMRCTAPLLAFWIACADAGAAESAGMVKTLTGAATVVRDSRSMPLAPGQHVYPGDRIAAGTGSYVGITLQDDTRLAIGPGGELLIREFAFDPSTYVGSSVISFLRGTARVVTGILAKQSPERVRYTTPTMTIGIRGTDFIVDMEAQP